MKNFFNIANIYTVLNKKTGVLEYIGCYKSDNKDCDKKNINAEEVLNEKALEVVKKLIDNNDGYNFQVFSFENKLLLDFAIAIVINTIVTQYKNANLIKENTEVIDINELIKTCIS